MSIHPLGIDLSQFPIRDHLIYMNHAGTSPIPRVAADMLKLFADEVSGYASAIYDEWTTRLVDARRLAAQLLHADTSEIAFSKSTTAGINLVALGLKWQPGDVVIAEERTFPANWLAWKEIAVHRGAELRVWPERNYRYELDDLVSLLKRGNVRLVAATTANFGTGFRQDMEAVGRLCREHGALLCVDAIQTLGVYTLDVRKCHIDFLAADSHKWLMGPESSGIFFCAKDRLDEIDPALVGWMGREGFVNYERLDLPPDPTARRFEEGSPNVAGTLAMAESMRLLLNTGIDRIGPHNDHLCQVLRAGLETHGWTVITPGEPGGSASIIAATRPGVDVTRIPGRLWEQSRIFAASRRGFLRLAPHFYQTEEDMRRVLAAIEQVS